MVSRAVHLLTISGGMSIAYDAVHAASIREESKRGEREETLV
jgi:hypothetical protein